MIVYKLPIPDVYRTVVRPISLQILNDIKPIFYIDSNVRTKLENQINEYITREQSSLANDRTKNPLTDSLDFSVKERVVSDTILTMISGDNDEFRPILEDKNIGALVKPVYVESEIVFEVTYRNRSKIAVENMINSFTTLVATNDLYNLHNIDYSYSIDSELVELFLEIYELKKNVVDDGLEFHDYLMSISDDRFRYSTNIKGQLTSIEFVAKEYQHNILGVFDSSLNDMGLEYDKDKGIWESKFEYSVRFHKPLHLYVKYHPVVYNQVLPEKYIVMINSRTEEESLGGIKMTKSADAMTGMTTFAEASKRLESDMLLNGVRVLNIPEYDKFTPDHGGGDTVYMDMFSILTVVTKDDPYTLFNLRDIPGYELNPEILTILSGPDKEFVTQHRQHPFEIYLFVGPDFAVYDRLYIDDNLNVVSKDSLSMLYTYRVVFSVVSDIMYLSADGKKRAAKMELYNKVFNDIPSIKDIRYNISNGRDGAIMYTKMITRTIAYRRGVN